MSNVLFTWELGGGFGHLVRHLPLARILRQRGHEVLFAAKELDGVRNLVTKEGFPCVFSPFSFDSTAAALELLNYADILAANGFSDEKSLSAVLAGWFSIFKEFQPDVLVAQSAPSSVFAAKLSGVPCMRVDCGFGSPPSEAPFPCFRPWLDVKQQELQGREDRVLGVINQACSDNGSSSFTSLQEVFKTSADLLLTVPELDHYTGRQNGTYVGPVFNIEEGESVEWTEGSAPRIFVYLRPFEGLPAILHILSSSGCNIIAALPGVGDDIRAAFASPSFQIHSQPVRLAPLLSSTHIAITHGGHGLASACLLAGVPMLLVPQVAEQLMTVYNFERLGIGKGVRFDEVGSKFSAAFMRMLMDSSYRENAGRLSRKYAGYDQERTIMRLCDAVELRAKSQTEPVQAV
jgi:UDP:flavonoid glycosyltransferase YjiC (YdhE family)